MDPEKKITYFAETDARNQRVPFGIRAVDRTKHVYVIGKTGMGKSTLLENMAVQDIRAGNGFCFMDPHGQTADLLLEYIPESRADDVLNFAPFDMDNPISFNIMEDVGFDKRHLVVSSLMAAFKKIWQDAWSARMEYILANTLLALLEYPDSTLLSVNRMYSDAGFRKKVVEKITDTAVRSFWVDEFAKYNERFATEATAAIQNKIGQFISNPLIRNIVGQPKSSFDIRDLMDNKKIMIVNLSKGRIGEGNANLLGSLLITKIYLAAMSRADVRPEEMKNLPNFYLFVDEFQSFANETFADILSEARKYKLNLTIAHQYIEQMLDEVRAAVFGNVGTMITFRVGATDAEVLEKEFAPIFEAGDIVNLGFAQIYLRLMIDGIGSNPFSARTLPPLEKPQTSSAELVKERSRLKYTKPRTEVEIEVEATASIGRDSNNGGGQQKGGGQGGQGGGQKGGYQKGGQGGNQGGYKGGQGGGQKPPEKKKPMFDAETKNQLQELVAKQQETKKVSEKPKPEIKKDHIQKNNSPEKKFEKKENVKEVKKEYQKEIVKKEERPIQQEKKEFRKKEVSVIDKQKIEEQKKALIDSDDSGWDGSISIASKKQEKKKETRKDNPKVVSKEHKDDLKAILAGMTGSSSGKKEVMKEKSSQGEVGNMNNKKKDSNPKKKEETQATNTTDPSGKKITEYDLKSMLHVE